MPTNIATLQQQLESTDDLLTKIDLLNTLTDLVAQNDLQHALKLNQQAIHYAWNTQKNQAPYPHGQAIAFHNMAKLNFQLAQYDLALSSAFEALSIFENQDDKEGQISILNTIATLYLHLSDYGDSLDMYLKVLQLNEILHDIESQAVTLNQIGQLHIHLGDYEKAHNCLERGFNIAQKIGNAQYQAEALNKWANVHTALGHHDDALRCGLESIQRYQAIQDRQGAAAALTSLGRVYQAQQEYTPALVYLEQALTTFRDLDAKYGIAETLSLMGHIYQKMDNLTAALDVLQQAQTLAEDIGARQIIYTCHQTLAQVHTQQKKYPSALQHYQQFHAIKESVFNDTINRRLKNLEIAHHVDSARKQALIVYLRNVELEREVTERKRAEKAQQASTARTDALYQLVRALASYDKLPAMLQAVAGTVANKLPAAQVVLHIFDFEKREVTFFIEGHGNFPHPFHPPYEYLMNSVVGWAITREQPLLSITSHPEPRESAAFKQLRQDNNIGAIIVIPMYHGGIMFGALMAMNDTKDSDFSYADLALLRAMSSQIAIAISNVQRTEETIQLKEFNESIVQGVGEAILIATIKGYFTFANPAVEQLLGYIEKELLGEFWNKIVPEEEIETLQAQFDKLTVEHHLRYETRLMHKDGHPIPVIVSFTELGKEGETIGVLAAFTNITELKQAEATLRQRSAELELQNAELDAFAHTVAHDLRSPLTTIVGFSDLLATRYDELSQDRRHYGMEAISDSGHKMSEIINELLVMSSVRSMDTLELQHIDMGEVVAQVQNRLSYQLEKSQAKVFVAEDWPIAMGYAQWVEEVWANYISNAIKYGGRPDENILPHITLGYDIIHDPLTLTAAPPPHIVAPPNTETETATETESSTATDPHIENAPPPSTCSHIRFWVQDNGVGLSQQAQDKLFMPFERLNKTHIEGHGLGLSIVQRIITKLGGEVGIVSEQNIGSKFYFTLLCPPESIRVG